MTFRDSKSTLDQDRAMPNSSLAYTRADLLRLRDLLEEKTGIFLSDEKLGRLETPLKDGNLTGSFATLNTLIQALDLGSAEAITGRDDLY